MDGFPRCAIVLALLLPVKCLFAGDSCIDNELSGSCVRLSDCKPLIDDIQKHGKPIPLHLRKRLQELNCGYESEEPVVCCAQNEFSKEPDVTVLHPVTIGPTEGTETKIRIGGPPDIKHHRNLGLLPKDCGVYDSDRIFGGNRTRLYEMPWMVLLSYDSARGTKLSCGGTLINQWYILTAAHCVAFLGDRLKLKGVVLGEYDIRKDPDCERIEGRQFCAPNVRNVSIDSVVAHPGYTLQTLVDDIALIRLAEPADFTLDSMKAICLPVTSKLQNEELTGQPGIVAGWGATEDGLQSPVLLSVDLPIVSNSDCEKAYNGTPRVYDRQLCAGGVQDKDSCGGDSGGPLMYPGSTGIAGVRYVQRGIVSYGSKRCGLGGYPGVYTRVAYYMDWILDHMKE